MDLTQNVLIGQSINKLLRERNIVVKHLLAEIKEKYPEERGLTENGFRYSIEHGTIKVALLIRIAKSLNISLLELLPDSHIISGPEMNERLEEKYAQEKRIKELETDKEMLIRMINMMEKEIEVYKSKEHLGVKSKVL